MYSNKTLSVRNLDFNFDETKKQVNDYFMDLEKLEWELAKINARKGLKTTYDFSIQYKKHPFVPIGKDEFELAIKESKEEQLLKLISSYYWAKSVLSDKEQIYISEYFINRVYEDEIVDLLGFDSTESNEFRKLKKSAIYKFADFLDLVVEKF